MSTTARHPLIVIEGIDGSGKKTHTTRLAEDLFRAELNAKRIDFPRYENLTGHAIYGNLVEHWKAVPTPEGLSSNNKYPQLNELAFQALMTVNRFEEINHVLECLEKGPVVLDRYWPSGFAYGHANGLPADWLIKIHSLLPKPDVCILLDVPVEASWARRPERRDRYEHQKDLLLKVRANYRALFEQKKAQKEPWEILPVDIHDPFDDVHESLKAVVRGHVAALRGLQ